MNPSTSPYVSALLGGALIGAAAILLLLSNGKIAGISGITGGLLRHVNRAGMWRLAFLGGLLAGGALAHVFGGIQFVALTNRSLGTIIAGGLLVGFGTQLGSGCTSGHGVCGIGRLSLRSLWATLTFIAAGALTVFIMNHLLVVAG